MKKIIVMAAALALMICAFALTVGAAEVQDPNARYYEKVFTAADGTELALYDKVGDTYYPLVWFTYDNQAGEKCYVKVHFEDVDTTSHAYSQGRLNGVSYTYVDTDGTE